ncbi:lipoprotein insertase outer membrane protein LolB [Herbaspirillum sp. RTI4]|uniref:lipoprotein insertase outer membrane protein LolB n=1 Tax=Herbaspirillum sp. RTI4 TaxID=3048640 RepID=UPI002AB38CD9|nr:lipoprotein insertase outer membrane protein LolB [Herbaspirillum sp. RTI4]MDY7577850.1 lipoprotein insertase outer membrane protein LolB [Herbaspirillum sp. RTI4]MEA9982468.1 lipoprotein insertase outer membrane protein LolB [Herbaspirillum sp. RTI4]
MTVHQTYITPSLQRSGLLAALTLALLVAGCAALPTPPAPSAGSASIVRTYQPSIRFSGRLSLRYQHNNAEQAVYGGFLWNQTPQHTSLTMLSPLGQTVAAIDITPDQATLTQSGKAPRYAADADSLMEQTLGWPLPIAGLGRWLQGTGTDQRGQSFSVPAAAESSAVTTADGWHIVYGAWQNPETPGEPNYPRRIDLTRTTQQAGEVTIRLVLDSAQTP